MTMVRFIWEEWWKVTGVCWDQGTVNVPRGYIGSVFYEHLAILIGRRCHQGGIYEAGVWKHSKRVMI